MYMYYVSKYIFKLPVLLNQCQRCAIPTQTYMYVIDKSNMYYMYINFNQAIPYETATEYVVAPFPPKSCILLKLSCQISVKL